jgi:hypothetical protein
MVVQSKTVPPRLPPFQLSSGEPEEQFALQYLYRSVAREVPRDEVDLGVHTLGPATDPTIPLPARLPIPLEKGFEGESLGPGRLEEGSVKKMAKLTWRVRGSGSTCTAEVDHPLRGYKVNPRSRSQPFAPAAPEATTPTVSWISFDGDVYWVRLSTAHGWPRTIRVTQNDVDGVRA